MGTRTVGRGVACCAGLAALVFSQACGRSRHASADQADAGGQAGATSLGAMSSAGEEPAAPGAGSAGTGASGEGGEASVPPSGSPAGAGGSIGVAGAGGSATGEPVALVASDAEHITQDIVADAQYFYFTTREAGPRDVVRLPRSGGHAEVLAHGDDLGELQLWQGILYYRTHAEIHAYDLSSGQDSIFLALPDASGSIGSFQVGPGGVYWAPEPWGQLQHRATPAAEMGPISLPLSVTSVLRVDQQQVVFGTLFEFGGLDVATGEAYLLANGGGYDIKRLAMDDDSIFYLRGRDLLQASRHSEVLLPESVGALGGSGEVPETKLSALESLPASDAWLFKSTLLVQANQGSWFRIGKADHAVMRLPELDPCAFVFSNETDLFCLSLLGQLFSISSTVLER